MKFDMYDTVIVLNDYLNEGILKGELGSVVEVYTKPREAYEVEFVDKEGKTKSILVLEPNEICKHNDYIEVDDK